MWGVVGGGQGLVRMEPSEVADNLNGGRGFVFEQYGATYRAWKEPLYIGLLAAMNRATGNSDAAVAVFQAGCGILTALGVMWLAARLWSDPARAGAAGLLAAVNPFLVYYDARFIHPLSFDVLGMVAVVASILWARRRGGGGSAAAAGAVMGLVLWQRATVLLAGAAAWAAAWVWAKAADRRRILQAGLVWLAVALAVIAPWLVRNARLVGRPLLTTDMAHIVWLGNNPLSNGTYSDAAGERVIHQADPAFRARLQGASEIEQYDLFLGDTRRFITEQPLQFIRLAAGRVWGFVWWSPNAGVEYAPWQRRIYQAWYVALLALGAWGLRRWWRQARSEARAEGMIALAAVAGLAVVHALTALNLKHRVPWELLLGVFAADAWCFLGRFAMIKRSVDDELHPR